MGECRREGFIEEGVFEFSFEGKIGLDGMVKYFWVKKIVFRKLDYEYFG